MTMGRRHFTVSFCTKGLIQCIICRDRSSIWNASFLCTCRGILTGHSIHCYILCCVAILASILECCSAQIIGPAAPIIFPRMRQLLDRLRCAADFCATYHTIDYLIITSCRRTRRCHYVFLHRFSRRMRQLLDRLRYAVEFCAAYRTVYYLVITAFCRTCRFCYVLMHRFFRYMP